MSAQSDRYKEIYQGLTYIMDLPGKTAAANAILQAEHAGAATAQVPLVRLHNREGVHTIYSLRHELKPHHDGWNVDSDDRILEVWNSISPDIASRV